MSEGAGLLSGPLHFQNMAVMYLIVFLLIVNPDHCGTTYYNIASRGGSFLKLWYRCLAYNKQFDLKGPVHVEKREQKGSAYNKKYAHLV